MNATLKVPVQTNFFSDKKIPQQRSLLAAGTAFDNLLFLYPFPFNCYECTSLIDMDAKTICLNPHNYKVFKIQFVVLEYKPTKQK